MSDVVVTVPKWFWREWIAEGDSVGEPETGLEWGFFLGGSRPDVSPGERCYIVAHGMLRGYAPVVRVQRTDRGWAIVRHAGAVAVTIAQPVPGFRGWRRRWWELADELPFPDWKDEAAKPALMELRP